MVKYYTVKKKGRDLALEAIAVLGRLSDAFSSRREALAASVGLTEGQWGLLEEISTERFMPSMFARDRVCSAAAVSKTLRQLREKGLVKTGSSTEDGRRRDYELTAKGTGLLATLRAERGAAIEAIWESLDPRDLKAFAAFGTELASRLEAYREKGKGG
jgi:DNA-binding MarR family transcriptional regulator